MMPNTNIMKTMDNETGMDLVLEMMKSHIGQTMPFYLNDALYSKFSNLSGDVTLLKQLVSVLIAPDE